MNNVARKSVVLAIGYIVIFVVLYVISAGAAWFVTLDISYWSLLSWSSEARCGFLIIYVTFASLFTIHPDVI